MFFSGARGHHQNGDAFGGRRLAQLSHQFVAGHARHFEVGYDQVAAVLGDEFGGFEAVGGQFYAVAVFLQHAADKFADADGVVGDDDEAFLVDAIDGFLGDGAAGHGGGARSENARGAGVGLQSATVGGLGGDETIQIDEKNQAAVGSDRGAGENLHAAEIFAETLDDDFVFAEDFFDDYADFSVAGVGDDHVKVAVDGFERRQTEIGVQANDFGDDIANLGEQLTADVFDFVSAQ